MNGQTHSTAYAELGPIRHSTSTEQPSSRNDGKTRRLIAELGLRFRPTAQADLEAHAATLALMTRDLADVNPGALERAIAEHVRCSRFMPKAAELFELVERYRADSRPISPPRAAPYSQKDIQDRDRKLFTPADWAELNGRLAILGATARYQSDGTRYTVTP